MAEHELKIPKVIGVRFFLPFLILVNDSLESEDDLDNQYFINLNGITASLRFKKLIRHSRGIGVALADKYGALTYSEVQVFYVRESLCSHNIDVNYMRYNERLINISLEYINHFINIYRDTTNTYWVRTITKPEIKEFIIDVIFYDGSQTQNIIGNLGTGWGLGGNVIDSSTDNLLRHRLLFEQAPNDARRLQLDAIYALDREDYPLSTMYLSIFYEMVIAIYIRRGFKSRGETDQQIDDRFLYPSRDFRSMRNLLTTYVPELVNIDLVKGNHSLKDIFDQWDTFVRPLRNDIAHGKNIKVSRDQAIKCRDTVFEFLKLFKRELEQKNLI